MIKWVKPNGNKIETNDLPATIEYVESLGWKRESGAKKLTKPEIIALLTEKGVEHDPASKVDELRALIPVETEE